MSAQLIRVSDGASLWSGSFEREAASPFEMEDELSRLIAAEVCSRLGVRKQKGRQPYVPSPAVSRLYLQGRHLWNQRTPGGVRDSIRYFDEAIAKDPGYALAYAALADSWAVLAMNEQAPVAEAATRAKEAARKALEIDPTLGEARATSAWLRFFHDWEFERARADFEGALRLRPGYATARQWFGLALLAQGEFDPAIRQFEKALELDPLSLIVITDLAVARYYQRRYEAAIERAREAVRLDNRFHFAQLILGASLLQQGRPAEAVEMMRSAVENSGNDPDCRMRLGHALALSGRPEEAEKILAEFEPAGSHHQKAFLHLGLGRYDRALDRLEQSLLLREPSLLFARVEPAFDPLRRMRRFQNLLAAVEKPSQPLKTALPGL